MTAFLCCAPFVYANAAPVATTAGSNLTGYNPSNSYNNQWATLSNGRYDTNTTAKADFGNCNTLIMRCAQPKCGGGGCADANVAAGIVTGCIKANSKCKQYGDDLIEAMTAQLVASSNAALNEQKMALEQAKIQADAAAAASAQSQEQMAQMQQQMAQMQQQMAEQQAESARQLQDALAQQAAQSAAALESMKAAATEAAKETESGVSVYQQDAINRGVSADVLERQKITGQIMTGIEDADLKLKNVKAVLQNSFKYAGCDSHGNNCTGPKRVKKWRELASSFIDDYDDAIDKIYDALTTAQAVGLDLSQIYMMLSDSCSSWGQYMCESGTIYYGEKVPMSCPTLSGDALEERRNSCATLAMVEEKNGNGMNRYSDPIKFQNCMQSSGCKPCTLLKVLTDQAEVYEGWINPDEVTDTKKGTVVACASNALNSTALFARRARNKNGAGLVDIDKLDTWLHQSEPSLKNESMLAYCYTKDQGDILKSSMLSKTIKKNSKFCVEKLEKTNSQQIPDDTCPYISGAYAICDTHPFNNGKEGYVSSSAEREEIKQMIAMKITVISQQMYKQYEYLNATLKRLKIQLEKATLTANLEAAGAKSDDSSSGGLLGSNKNSQYTNCSGKDFDGTLYCLRQNYALLAEKGEKCKQADKKQLEKDTAILNGLLTTKITLDNTCDFSTTGSSAKCESCITQYNLGLINLQRENDERQYKLRGWK